MKNVIALRELQVTMKTCHTILQPYQLESQQKKTCGNESHEKETKHILAAGADLSHIRKGKFD